MTTFTSRPGPEGLVARPGREPRRARRRRPAARARHAAWWCSPRRSCATSASPRLGHLGVRRAARRSVRGAADRRSPASTASRMVAGMFEVSDDPDRPYNTLVVVDARRAAGVVPQDPPLRLLRLQGVRPAARRARSSRCSSTSAGFAVGLMTCYDLRFPELARELVARGAELLVVPSAWVAGPGQGRALADAGQGARDREHRVRRRGRPARAPLHRPLAGRRPGRRAGRRGGRRGALLQASVDHAGLRQARATTRRWRNRRF